MSLPEGLRLHDVERPPTDNINATITACLKLALRCKISSDSRLSALDNGRLARRAAWLRRGVGCWRGMGRGGHTGLLQGAVEQGAEFSDWARSIHHLAVHKHGGGAAYPHGLSFFHRSFHRFIFLVLDARLQFGCVQMELATFRKGGVVEGGELIIEALL